MSDFTLSELLDLEAVVDNEEEDDESDEGDFDNFFDNETLEDTAEIVQDASRMAQRYVHLVLYSHEVVLQHDIGLGPREDDPKLWSVRVKPGFEISLVMQIGRRTIASGQLPCPNIASVFAREGTPGHIFLEGILPKVRCAVQGLVTVIFNKDPVLIPLAQRDALLMPRNPLSHPIKEGFVCGRDPSRDADTIVALVPWIPERPNPGKRKRGGRPEPRRWTALQIETVWGPLRLNQVTAEDYEFCGERFISGLIIKHIPSSSLAIIQGSPNNISPFLRASYIHNLPSFAPWVKVESRDHCGAIGQVSDINDSVATVVLDTTADGPMLLIPLRALAPFYADGDHIKFRWSESWGTVMSVDEASMTLTYNTTLLDAVEPYTPPRRFYQFKEGAWVEFSSQGATDGCKRHGYVKEVNDQYAFVIDEHTLTEFMVDVRELEVCSIQGPSLPKNDPIHPLLGKRIVVKHGHRKGYSGYIREVGSTALTVELDALVTGTSSPYQLYKWDDLMDLPPEIEDARSNPAPRARTPSLPPDSADVRAQTPEPIGSHWIFSSSIQAVLEHKCILFYIRRIRNSNDVKMHIYEGDAARTVPTDHCKSLPREGEVTVNVIHHRRHQQISIDPIYLVPWVPVVGCDVVILNGPLRGAVGAVKESKGKDWIITFTVDDDSRDSLFEEKDLASLEPLVTTS
ncbi:hypothetical protein BJY52DRAFT_1221185 [Lactarius psammicola]|nr:hypothetical protein BJY52DRAFT_1221185 [Lactarius psammicola]